MKQNEKIFFKYCLWRQNYVYYVHERYGSEDDYETFREVMRKCHAIFDIPYRQMLYYLRKWHRKGFYDYSARFDLGWFKPTNFKGEYQELYEESYIRYKKYILGIL